jgi:hypothetical protein
MDQRTEALSRAVNAQVSHGWSVVSQSPTQAQLVKGKHHSHVLHLILTLLTLGLWLVVWIPLAVFGGEKHRFISVNEQGVVSIA